MLNVRSAYQHLAILAAEAGADIMIKANVTSRTLNMENHISELKVHTPKGDLLIACTLVIDASGFNTSIGRKAGIVNEWKRYGVGAEYECYCENIDPDTWQLMVGQDYSNAGYAWVFPLSRNRVRIGVGIGRPESDEDPLQKLHYIMEKRYKPMDKMGKIQPIEFHYGFIPNQGFRSCTVSDGIILVGDSAGQANPLLLEGIRYAIEFGRLAGEVGARSLSKNAVMSSLMEYDTICREKLESKIKSALKVSTDGSVCQMTSGIKS